MIYLLTLFSFKLHESLTKLSYTLKLSLYSELIIVFNKSNHSPYHCERIINLRIPDNSRIPHETTSSLLFLLLERLVFYFIFAVFRFALINHYLFWKKFHFIFSWCISNVHFISLLKRKMSRTLHVNNASFVSRSVVSVWILKETNINIAFVLNIGSWARKCHDLLNLWVRIYQCSPSRKIIGRLPENYKGISAVPLIYMQCIHYLQRKLLTKLFSLYDFFFLRYEYN